MRIKLTTLLVVITISLPVIVQASAVYDRPSLGKFYKFSSTPSTTYPDEYPVLTWSDGSKLTDEAIGDGGSYAGWVGWSGSGTVFTITVDLGTVFSVDNYKARMRSQTSWAIYYPSQVLIETSTDGIAWTSRGALPIASPSTTNYEAQETSLTTNFANARFVKYLVTSKTNGGGVFTMLDELSVFGSIVNTQKKLPFTAGQAARAYHGVYPSTNTGLPNDNLSVALFEDTVQLPAKMVLHYAGWDRSFSAGVGYYIPPNGTYSNLNEVSTQSGSTPHRYLQIGFLPHSSSLTPAAIRQGDAAGTICGGNGIAPVGCDTYLKKWFEDLKARGYDAIWVRPMNEMNINIPAHYWSCGPTDLTCQLNFRRAFRRFYNIAEQVFGRDSSGIINNNNGIPSNTIIMWSPGFRVDGQTLTADIARYWPGHQYVDWVGLSLYQESAPALTPTEQFQPISSYIGLDASGMPNKPLMVAEGGSMTLALNPTSEGAERGKSDWIQDWYFAVSKLRLSGLVWFNRCHYSCAYNDSWRVDNHLNYLDQYRFGAPYLLGQ